jgi:hypothetical protein
MKTVINNGGGVTTTVALQDGNLITGTTQDCNPYVDHAAHMRREGLTGSADLRLAASVPFVVVEKYCNEKGISFREFSGSEAHKIAFLNNPDYKALRVWEGRV